MACILVHLKAGRMDKPQVTNSVYLNDYAGFVWLPSQDHDIVVIREINYGSH